MPCFVNGRCKSVSVFSRDLILRAVSAGMRSAGLTTAPLVTALILLTMVLLVVPEKSTPGRLIKETLQPAVKFVDAQIACIFIPCKYWAFPKSKDCLPIHD